MTNTFTLTGISYTVILNLPSFGGCEDGKINKQLDRFEFWSDNYEVHDVGIDSQPLRLCGIEVGLGKGELCIPFCVPFCFGGGGLIYNKFKYIWVMQDRHEEITITGLGDCYNAVYVIKEFSFNTTPRHGKNHLTWNMSLEKVRD